MEKWRKATKIDISAKLHIKINQKITSLRSLLILNLFPIRSPLFPKGLHVPFCWTWMTFHRYASLFTLFYTALQHTHTIILLLFWILFGTTRMSRYQKGKTNLDLLEQEKVSGSGSAWPYATLNYSLWPLARSSLRVTHGFTSSPIVHSHRVPPCMAQSRLGAFPR